MMATPTADNEGVVGADEQTPKLPAAANNEQRSEVPTCDEERALPVDVAAAQGGNEPSTTKAAVPSPSPAGGDGTSGGDDPSANDTTAHSGDGHARTEDEEEGAHMRCSVDSSHGGKVGYFYRQWVCVACKCFFYRHVRDQRNGVPISKQSDPARFAQCLKSGMDPATVLIRASNHSQQQQQQQQQQQRTIASAELAMQSARSGAHLANISMALRRGGLPGLQAMQQAGVTPPGMMSHPGMGFPAYGGLGANMAHMTPNMAHMAMNVGMNLKPRMDSVAAFSRAMLFPTATAAEAEAATLSSLPHMHGNYAGPMAMGSPMRAVNGNWSFSPTHAGLRGPQMAPPVSALLSGVPAAHGASMAAAAQRMGFPGAWPSMPAASTGPAPSASVGLPQSGSLSIDTTVSPAAVPGASPASSRAMDAQMMATSAHADLLHLLATVSSRNGVGPRPRTSGAGWWDNTVVDTKKRGRSDASGSPRSDKKQRTSLCA